MINERISIHVLNANRVGELDILLSSLLSQTISFWDLIILDESDGPSIAHKHINDLLMRIKCSGHGVIYKHVPAIHNIGQSRNNCFEMDEFKNDLVVRIDDDSYCDPEYLEKLFDAYTYLRDKGVNVGAVGGIVPVCGAPGMFKKIPKIFNEIKFNDMGDIVSMGDDGGWNYEPAYSEEQQYVPSHHLRSSFLFTRKAFLAVEGFPLEYGFNGFREETDFSVKLAFAGFKMFTVPDAICWHLQAGGGSRQFPPEQYAALCQWNDEHFKGKVRYWFTKKGGSPFK